MAMSLRQLREQAGYPSQRALARASGVHYVTVHLIETGQTQPQARTLRALARALSRGSGRPYREVLADLMEITEQEVEHAGTN